MKTIGLILLLLAGSARAAEIRGTVRDAGGDPLPGVSLFVKGTQTTVVTEADGRFAIPAAGPVTLVAFLGGFTSQEIDAAPGQAIEITLTLAPVSDAITVTARADREAPMSTYEQRPLDIVRTPGAAGDVFRALQTLPGVVKTDEGAGLFVRGGDVSETRVMLDGATIDHPYRFESPAGGQSGAVEPFLLQGVSFSTGGFSARYGNVLSGIVDLRGLGTPRSDTYTATAGLAGLSTRIAQHGSESRGFRASGNLRFPRLLFAVNGNPRDFDRYPGGWDLNASAHIDTQSLGRFKFFAMEQRTSVGVEIEQENFTGFLHADTQHDVFAGSWKTVAAGWQLSSALGANLYRNTTRAGVLALANDDQRLSWRLDLSRAAGATIVRIGSDADAARQSIHGTVPNRGGDLGGNGGTRDYDVDYRDVHAGIYGELERTFGKLTATAGLRADHAQRAGAWIDPRLNLTYALPHASQLRFAWGIYRQAPAAQYYDRIDGARELEPMQAQHLIAGFEHGDPDAPLHLRIEAYQKDYERLPLDDDRRGYTSDGYGHARGLDLYLRRRWSLLDLRASYSFLQSRRRWTPHDQRRRFDIPDGTWLTDFDVPHSGELVASLAATPRFTIGSALRIATGRPFTPIVGAREVGDGYEPVYGTINSERMPRYQRLDLSFSYRSVRETRSFVYFASVSNLFARRNTFQYSYSHDYSQRTPVVSATPRTFYAGVSVTR